jgi:hypothetical protein
MSKKSKRQKLKKRLRALLRAQMIEAEREIKKETHKEESKISKIQVVPEKEKIEKKEIKNNITPKETVSLIEKETLTQKLTPYFAYDIRKVFMTIGISLVLIVGITVISKYTNWLNLFSQKLFSLLHLG